MTPLFTSWACDYCDKAPPQLSGGVPLTAVDAPKPRGYPTGFSALDAITCTDGYPIEAISELFGNDSALLDKCWQKLPGLTQLDLDWRTEDLLVQVSHLLAACPMLAIKVYGGDGRRYADLATRLNDLVTGSGSGIVLFNGAVRTNPLCSAAPLAVKFVSSLRIRLMSGVAAVVKSRWGHTGLWCSI